MKILVTGSTGFVGKALIERLNFLGHEARGFSRSSHPLSCKGDLLDRSSIEAALASFAPEIVYNLAAETDFKGSRHDGYPVNTKGVANLIEATAAAPSVERVVWMSSQLVGQPGTPPASDTDYNPVGDYGRSKVEGERLVRASDGGGKTWVIVRSTTIWGPGMSEHYLGALRLIRRGLYFHVGSKPLMKSFSYIENLTAQLATLAIVESSRVQRKTVYLADSEQVDLRAWADGFAAHFGRTIPTLPTAVAHAAALVGDIAARLGLPAPLTTPRLNNMLTRYVYDTSPIEALHGRTSISNREGVDRTAAWFLATLG
jgi:nucleoside-diphosphate-sugar epimerase